MWFIFNLHTLDNIPFHVLLVCDYITIPIQYSTNNMYYSFSHPAYRLPPQYTVSTLAMQSSSRRMFVSYTYSYVRSSSPSLFQSTPLPADCLSTSNTVHSSSPLPAYSTDSLLPIYFSTFLPPTNYSKFHLPIRDLLIYSSISSSNACSSHLIFSITL